MTSTHRRKFTRISDWHNHLNELQAQGILGIDLYSLRKACYQDIEQVRQRPLIVYAVQFPPPLTPPQIVPPISIDLEDIDGFVDLVDSIEEDVNKIDILIHSPGGSPEATERIVDLIRGRFQEVSFLVPHSAYSAATMLALSGEEIIMLPSASLGPIDPQINGVPSRALRRGFENARKVLKEEGPEALPAYIPLIEKYSLELLEICEDYERLSKELVTDWLSEYMFRGLDKTGTVEEIVEFFSSHDDHKTHSRSLTYKRLKPLGLNISLANGELKNLLREAHVLLSGFFNLTSFVKIFENSAGLSWGKQFELMIPQQATPPVSS